MNKRITGIFAALSLIPFWNPLVIGTGVAFTTSAVILSAPESVKAESSLFYFESGLKKIEKGDFYGAISDFNKAIKTNKLSTSNLSAAYDNIGYSKHEIGDLKGAISSYNKAIDINPNNDNAYNNRGVVNRELGNYYQAISDYNKAIKINPSSSDAYNNRAKAKYLLEDFEGSCRDANEAASLGSKESQRILRGSIGTQICGSSTQKS